MDLFIPIRFRTSVQLTPSELTSKFELHIKNKLSKTLEGVCSRFGYIKQGSIEILKRSAGQFVKQHFNGHIRFEMICKAEVCNPPQGSILKASVKNKNAMGLFAESNILVNNEEIPVLDIIVPRRAAGIVSDIDLEDIDVGDEIYVAVQGKRFQMKDRKISIIGKAVPKPEKVKPVEQEIEETDLGELRDEVYNSSEEEETENPEDEESQAESEDEFGLEEIVPKPVKTIDIGDIEEEIGEVEEEEFFEEGGDELDEDDYDGGEIGGYVDD